MDGIDADARSAAAAIIVLMGKGSGQLGVGAAENSFGCDVSIRQPVKRDNRAVGSGQQDFIVYRVDAHLAERALALDLCFVSLDDAKRRLLSAGRAPERQDGLRQRTSHHDLIVNGIEGEVMHGPAEH